MIARCQYLHTFSSCASRAVTTLLPRGEGLKSFAAEDMASKPSWCARSSAVLCVDLSVSGAPAYGLLKSESHLHRQQDGS